MSWKLETTVTPATYSADSGPGAGGPTKIPAKLKALRRKHANSLVALVDLEAIFLAAATNHRLLRLRCFAELSTPAGKCHPLLSDASTDGKSGHAGVGLLFACGDGETGASLSAGLMRSPGAGLGQCNPGLRL